MSVRNLSRMLAPARVAVIGASPKPGSLGGLVLDNIVAGGFAGIVHPVNPNHAAVHGIEAYPHVADLPAPPDLAVLCTPARTVPDVVRECGQAGVAGVAVLSAGFREAGGEGVQLERRLVAEAASFDGLRILGPNCLGVLVPGLGLNASFARARPRAGHIAFVSQSGALVTSVLDWAAEQDIGFSTVVSAGNMLDIDVGDLIDHLGQDPATRSLILYLESVTEPRKFMSAARAFARTKPIVAYKAGRFAQSAQAAVSHTGALAGADDVYEAAFRRAGIVRVREIDDIFDAAELLSRQHLPRGPRLAVVTNAGGPGVMAADALLERDGALAELSPETGARLQERMPGGWSGVNPIDVLGDATVERFGKAAESALADEGVDALLAILTPQAMTQPRAIAESVASAAFASRKPTLAAWMGGAAVREGREKLERAGVATYETPGQAVGAFMQLVAYARNREVLYETPRAMPVTFELDRERVRELLSGLLVESDSVLSEAASKALLEAYGIQVAKPLPAQTADDAVLAAERIGYPVVLKVRSPQVTHKTDVGGVVTNLENGTEVRVAFERIADTLARNRPDARFEGVSVQQMVLEPGHELILGARKDPTFGAVIMLGAGGVAAELLGDSVLELPPLNERLARRMLEALRIWPLLQGYRGRPGADVDELLEVLIRFSYLVADYPEIAEIEINPLLAGAARAVALDARIALDADVLRSPVAQYAHLAIRPYPEELTTQAAMRDGTSVTLRPIKPEDEPRWHELLAQSSLESIRMRFGSLFRTTTHQMASRYCFIDYDREMAIVAELEEQGRKRLIAVGRIVSDPDRREAEFAILVADPWQNRGLSGPIMERCLEIARHWGVKRVWAMTRPENRRMIAAFRRQGFTLDRRSEPGMVRASLELAAEVARPAAEVARAAAEVARPAV